MKESCVAFNKAASISKEFLVLGHDDMFFVQIGI